MKNHLLVFTIGMIVLIGCASTAAAEEPTQPMIIDKAMPQAESGTANMTSDDILADSPTSEEMEAGAIDRMIILNATMEITVINPQETSKLIQQMADEYGGYLVQSNISPVSQYIEGYGYYYLSQANISFRVPAQRLNEAMDFVRSQVNDPDLDIANENISGEDVTKQYTDLDAQLTSSESAKETLMGFLDSAKKTEDVLDIYREIHKLDMEIERIKGEMKYYEESSAYSAVTVAINQSQAELEQIRKDRMEKINQNELNEFDIVHWRPVVIGKQALELLVNVLIGIGSVLIWIILFIAPVLIVIGAPIYLLVKLFSNRRKKKAQPKE